MGLGWDSLAQLPEMAHKNLQFGRVVTHRSFSAPLCSHQDLIALYAYGVDPAIHQQAHAAHWYTHLLPAPDCLDTYMIADILELFIKYGSRVRYYFVGCDSVDYLPLFKKAKGYGIDTVNLFCFAVGGVTIVQAQARALGAKIEYIADVYE